MKESCRNNKFNISVPTLSKNFDLPDGPYSVSGIQDYFAYIFKIHGQFADNPPMQVYINQIERKIIKTKLGYYLELFIPETVKLHGETDGETVSHVEITDVRLIHCNVFNISY